MNDLLEGLENIHVALECFWLFISTHLYTPILIVYFFRLSKSYEKTINFYMLKQLSKNFQKPIDQILKKFMKILFWKTYWTIGRLILLYPI